MDRATKHAFVKTFTNTVKNQSLLVITRQTGLSVLESEVLRGKARKAEASFKIVKNTLLRLVLKDHCEGKLVEHLKGPTGIAYSEDPIAAARAVADFTKENKKLEIVAGALDGNFLDANAVKALASLPSLDVLRATIACLVSAPGTAIARTVSAPGAGLVRLVSAYSKK